jgi:AGCS family alanine or glycine:cation symporter
MMKKLLTFLLTFIFTLATHAQETLGLDEKIDHVFGDATGWFVKFIFYQIPITDEVGLFWVLIPLVVGALFFTIYFGVPGIKLLPLSIRTVRGDYEHIEQSEGQPNSVDGDNPDTIRIEGADGEVSHFQALTAALSATVGLGNIAGVAVAVVVGGAGATFWMILAGILGMSSKFVECTLGVKYREVGPDGKIYGGPMYYLKKGFREKNQATLGKILAVLFAVLCIGGSFGGGNMFQANQATSMLLQSFNISGGYAGSLVGLVMSIVVGLVIIGGIKRIAQVTEKIVPFMAIIYVGAALIIIFLNYQLIPLAISTIVTKAFAPTAVAGGFLGVLVQGFKRAAFSNEAGVGSAAIAHSAVKTKYPASEGVVALLEPLIDTVIICTMTALVIVIGNLKGLYAFGGSNGDTTISETGQVLSGVDLTSYVFDNNIPHFSYVLTIAVVLFAFSTMISWSYYGLQSWTYLFGKSKNVEIAYKVLFCLFVIIGSAAKMGNVLDFSDAMIFGMMVPNMIGLLFLYPKVKEELTIYLNKIKESRA